MKPSIRTIRLSAVTVLAFVVAGATAVACSSSNANPTPVTVFDGGVSTQIDSSTPVTIDDSGVANSADVAMIDANLPDVGSCMSDAATCNSCYTVQNNPLNACSPATVNCVPFDNTRVPTGAP